MKTYALLAILVSRRRLPLLSKCFAAASQGNALHLTHACPASHLRSAGPMLERWVQLAVEIAKWEAEEKERQRREDMRAARQQTGLPRPLMIRTGKAKTDGEARPAVLLRCQSVFDGVAAPHVPSALLQRRR